MNNTDQYLTAWTSTGAWPGGTITDVLLLPDDPKSILAASRAGLFRSDDWGETWQGYGQGIDDPAVLALAIAQDAGDRTILFAATASGRLYRSADAGLLWQEVTAWAGLGVATALAVSSAYAHDQTLFVATTEGPFRSQDGGQTWESSTFGLVDADVLDVACAPDFAHSGVVWLGTALGGLYRSRNEGRSWRDAGQGLPDTAIQCLAVGDAALYAGTESDGVYRSTDGGQSWRRAGLDLAGLSVNALALDPAAPDQLLACTEEGVFYSENEGETWRRAANGDFIALALALGPNGRAVAGTWQEGAFVSEDGGRHWRQANGGAEGRLIAHAPPLSLLAPDGDFFAVDLDGVCVRSQDQGRTWQHVTPNETDGPIQVLAGGGKAEAFTIFVGGDQLYRREGDGNWLALATPAISMARLALSPNYAQDRTLLLAGGNGGLYLSTEAGESWHMLPIPWIGRTLLNVTFSPFDQEDTLLYAVTAANGETGYQMEVWQSVGGGESWVDVAAFTAEAPAVAVLPLPEMKRRPLCLAVQHRFIVLYTEPDAGDLAVDQHFLPDGVRIAALAASPTYTEDRTLFAATSQGVWSSHDGGATWQPLGAGLDRPAVAVHVAPDGIRAVTLGGEVWLLSNQH